MNEENRKVINYFFHSFKKSYKILIDMAKILGLDLGTNSIGWALIDDKLNKILGIGSRIFPMGVENLGDGDNEMSKNASRTGARGVRRQFFII